MRSSTVLVASSLVALAFAVGCSSDPFAPSDKSQPPIGGGSEDGGDAGDAAVRTDAGPSTPDAALPPSCDGKKLPSEDACVIDEAAGVFVSINGSSSGDGSRVKPFASIAAGVAAAKTAKKRVYVCAGSYAESVSLADGVAMFGGFDCTAWTWNAAGRAKIASPTSPALRADAIATDTRVEGFDVVAPAGNASAPSSIGFIAKSSPGVRFVHGSITAGDGFAGAPGADGIQLSNGSTANGEENTGDGKCGGFTAQICIGWHTSRAGGINTCVGKTGIYGGPGGSGGDGGSYIDNGFQWSMQTPTKAGGPTFATPATAAGSTGTVAAQAGASGAGGSNGASGANVGLFSINGYAPSDGTSATDGAPGQGGGGGAGVGIPDSRLNSYTQGSLVYGIPGSGGGAGGCPGLAGEAGKGGGASVALLASDSPMNFEDAKLTSGAGGTGGAAGASTAGTAGGTGGPDVSNSGLSLNGKFLGASGGAGGNAGLSGQGGGGPSIGYAYHGGVPTFLSTTVTSGLGGKGAPAKAAPAGTIPASPDGLAAKSVTF